ncbi:MAG: hypothetical protein E5V75_33750 [Mesorhizobium sp.]|nr:MAG: hypothetical protein E5V75_33750 [Mesorhizobium sp.]
MPERIRNCRPLPHVHAGGALTRSSRLDKSMPQYVYVEHDAGAAAGATDTDYQAVGAEVVPTNEAWTASPFLLKYKFPSATERQYLCRPLHRRVRRRGIGGFVSVNGVICAGAHYIVDLFGGTGLDNPDFIETAITKSAQSSGAAVLFSKFHRFSPEGGHRSTRIGGISHQHPHVARAQLCGARRVYV